jgi:hypothetical protein
VAASFLPVAIVAVVWLGALAASVSASIAQPVASAEMDGSFPYGKPVSMESGTGRTAYGE